MKVKKIVIKRTSGYWANYSYSDELTITSNSICYEFKPLMDNLFNIHKKWEYKIARDNFDLMFEKIGKAVKEIIESDLDVRGYDTENIDFIVIYDDESKAHRDFWASTDDFEEFFKIIRKIIPKIDDIQTLIRFSENCEDKEE